MRAQMMGNMSGDSAQQQQNPFPFQGQQQPGLGQFGGPGNSSFGGHQRQQTGSGPNQFHPQQGFGHQQQTGPGPNPFQSQQGFGHQQQQQTNRGPQQQQHATGMGNMGGFPSATGGNTGGSSNFGTITGSEAHKWKQEAQYAFNKAKQISLLTEWLGNRQIELSGAEWIIGSTDQSNQVEVANILVRHCTEDRAKMKAGFSTHMQRDNWISVFGK
ncbi:unnamed protein product [Didymodactylos carnosus]|uniref:Uncharacterized protein n=1 Tax=Didymodactylos carnosus TaxID=1234261 RepID=A0A814G2Z3_9BILA|nr:unnamed protein product [Didymodactylos carnosus]CAF0992087.1 unnamed protein product [Didymodactylos carnosus]CAF3538786.1 unnamed protein product [Didymodactylos carnosus]CAF3763998.1 unnamed protein product [Didymodactylos carnosus]